MAKLTTKQVQDGAKAQVIEMLKNSIDTLVQVGSAEYALTIETLGKDGETPVLVPITLKATAKGWEDISKGLAYDIDFEADQYEKKVAESLIKAEEKKKASEKKKARDKAEREQKKLAKEKTKEEEGE